MRAGSGPRIGPETTTELAAAAGEDGRQAGEAFRYYWLLLSESHLTRRLFASMLWRIDELPLPSG